MGYTIAPSRTTSDEVRRWIVASNTSYLKQITEPDELVQGVPRAYRQFRLVVGSATKEHLLAKNVLDAQARCGRLGRLSPGY